MQMRCVLLAGTNFLFRFQRPWPRGGVFFYHRRTPYTIKVRICNPVLYLRPLGSASTCTHECSIHLCRVFLSWCHSKRLKVLASSRIILCNSFSACGSSFLLLAPVAIVHTSCIHNMIVWTLPQLQSKDACRFRTCLWKGGCC